MSVAQFFSKAEELPFEERVELAYRLWDEFMDGFQGWKASPMPEGNFGWKTLKAEIDFKLRRAERIELAQRVWSHIVEDGYDWEPTHEKAAELERRAEDARANPDQGIPSEQVQAELKAKYGWR